MKYIKLKNKIIFNITSLIFSIDGQVRIGVLDISDSDAKKIFSNKNSISEISILDSDKNSMREPLIGYNKLVSIITINVDDKKISYINSNKEECIANTETFIFLGKEEE